MAQNQHQKQKVQEDFLGRFRIQTIQNDQLELVFIPEHGCHWQTLRAYLRGEWIDLLKPLSCEETKLHFGSYVMSPWSNRIVQGVFKFEGKTYQLRKNFPDETAIHGDVRTRPWQIVRSTPEKFEAVLDSRNFPDFNFPFKLKFKHSLELSHNQLGMSLFIENVDTKRAPVGFGFHPFFKRCLTKQDEDVMVILPAEKVYPDEKCIPTGPAVAVSGAADLRSERWLGSPNLDDCYTGLTGNVIRLIYPGSEVEVHYRIDPVFSHVVVYAPNESDGSSPRDFVAVEPVTHVNNGFNLYAERWQGTGIKVLEPGEIWGGACELSIFDRS
ncbi:MAG: hypothetical protein HYS55_04455 [Candidatus Omnitrophica bacterium]|nr:hypothetical protein [Candidatus Omnitrophota bacterium]